MGWFYLVLAGFFEIAFAICLKLSDNWTRPVPSALFVVFSLVSFFLLSLAVRTIPIGVAYAVWTGIGAFGTVVISLTFFEKQRPGVLQVALLAALLVSVIGLKLVAPEGEPVAPAGPEAPAPRDGGQP
jgi:quaternary ammonium compound-resistance protein SugE